MKRAVSHSVVSLALACLALGPTACVDSPTETADAVPASNQLASSFDALAEEQDAAGDVERGEEFRWASLALRLGVAPTRFEVTNNGAAEVYNAFVHEARWILPSLALRPATHRAFVAWRKADDRLQVILISMATDSAVVLHPFSMRPAAPGGLQSLSPIASAQAGYFEHSGNGSSWVGIGGMAKISQISVGEDCKAPRDDDRPKGISCRLARFAVLFNINFARTRETNSRLVEASAPTRRILAAQQPVAGVKLTFSCVAPVAGEGC